MIMTGTKVSELNNFDFNNIFQNKIMLILEPDSSSDTTNFKDRYIYFEDLQKDLYEGFEEYCGFKDMIYHNKEEYSKVNHEHSQYNNLSVVNIQYKNTFKILSLNIDNKTTDIYTSFSAPKQNNVYEIGELKFVLRNNFKTYIDINSEDFDGWVYADGKEYKTESITDFIEAKKNFLSSSDGYKFTIPLLDNFIKPSLSSLNYDKVYNSKVTSNSSTVIPNHTHKIEFPMTGTNTVNLNTPLSKTKDTSNNILLRGKGKIKTNTFSVQLHPKNLTINSLTTTATGSNDESYPQHNLVPIMIYIGKRYD